MGRRHSRVLPGLPQYQRGAVLYVALIMLILLSLLGIAGMQVANMQEKMASNYLQVNIAFQRSEQAVRNTERQVEALVNRDGSGAAGSLTSGSIEIQCDNGYDPSIWASTLQRNSSEVVKVRQIESCIQGEAPLGMGRVTESATPIFQITSYASDADGGSNPGTSAVVIDTIFKL